MIFCSSVICRALVTNRASLSGYPAFSELDLRHGGLGIPRRYVTVSEALGLVPRLSTRQIARPKCLGHLQELMLSNWDPYVHH